MYFKILWPGSLSSKILPGSEKVLLERTKSCWREKSSLSHYHGNDNISSKHLDAFGLGGFLKRYRDKLPESDLTTTKVPPIFMLLWQPVWHGIQGSHNHNQICLTDSSNIIPLNPIILPSHSVYHVPWISRPFLPPDFGFSYFPSFLLHSNIKFHPSLEAVFQQLLLLPQLWSTPPASHLHFS